MKNGYFKIYLTIAFATLLFSKGYCNNYRLKLTTNPDSVSVYRGGLLIGVTPCFVTLDYTKANDTLFFRFQLQDSLGSTVIDTLYQYKHPVVRMDMDVKIDLTSAIKQKPLKNYTGAPTLSIGNIIIDMKADSKISNLGQYYVSTEYETSKDFKPIAEQECLKSGIKIIGALNLFEADKKEAQFTIGARIKNFYFNYGSFFTGLTSCQTTIEWQLYDNIKREVVFTNQIEYNYLNKHKLTLPISVFYESYRINFFKLLQADEFYKVFAQSKAVADESSGLSAILISKSISRNPINIKSSISEFQSSVVTVKSGINRHGSGFLVSEDGYIITNYHVIEKADTIEIIFNNGFKLPVKVVSINRSKDMALLKVSGGGFKPLPLGNSDSAAVGDEIITIGTPLSTELGQSVSKGILSGRRIDRATNYLQFDASVSPGNSGGPLINSNGEVIGIVSAKAIVEGAEGVSFAIPINEAVKVLNIGFTNENK